MKVQTVHAFILLFLFVSLCGCGEKLPYEVVAVRGTVTFDGQPAPKGLRLRFAPANGEGRPSEAIVSDGGKFKAIYTRSVEGVQVGKVILTVSWSGEPGAPMPPEAAAIIKNFGGNTTGFPMEITKPDKDCKIQLVAL